MTGQLRDDGEVWLIGGYGDLGAKIARLLTDHGRRPVVIAGRIAEKADQAARSLGNGARGEMLDVSDRETWPKAASAAAVVNLVENGPVLFPLAIMEAGGIYLDTSASPRYLRGLEGALCELRNDGLAVLSVGLSPGLTNIMARELKTYVPEISRLDICVEMGLGRHYGGAATEWFLRSMAGTYPCMIDGLVREISPGGQTKDFRFDGDSRMVPAIGFGFSDQLTIAERLRLDTVRSFVALDPAWATRLTSALLATGISKAISRNAATITGMMAKGPVFGRVRTRVSMEGWKGREGPVGRCGLVGGDQTDITAVMVATALDAALASDRNGIVHSDDLVDFGTAASAMQRHLPELRTWLDVG